MHIVSPATTAHLTRIQLAPWSRDAGHDIANAQNLHRRVLSLIPDQLGAETRQAAGLLFRLERTSNTHILLIQSTAPLDLSALPVGYATATDERDLTPLLTWCQAGKTVRYRITTQPFRSIATKERNPNGRFKRGRRTYLFGEEAINWWHRKSEHAGLDLDPHALRVTEEPDITGWKPDPHTPDKQHKIRESITRFEGVATITNPDALRTALVTGIGQRKAYGAGLLSIAPLIRP